MQRRAAVRPRLCPPGSPNRLEPAHTADSSGCTVPSEGDRGGSEAVGPLSTARLRHALQPRHRIMQHEASPMPRSGFEAGLAPSCQSQQAGASEHVCGLCEGLGMLAYLKAVSEGPSMSSVPACLVHCIHLVVPLLCRRHFNRKRRVVRHPWAVHEYCICMQ